MLAAEPTVTDWMQGWGSIAGVVMAALAALFTGLLLRHEARVRREEKADSEVAQARLVFGEVLEGDPTQNSTGDSLAGRQPLRVFGVRNYSTAPIFSIHVGVRLPRASAPRLGDLDASFGKPVVPAGASHFEPSDELVPPPSIDAFEVTVWFVDASGAAWRRTGLDDPVRIRWDLPAPWWRTAARRVITRIRSH